MNLHVYDIFKTEVLKQKINLLNDVLKVALLSSSHSFSAGDVQWSDVSNNEVTGDGYDAGGNELQDKVININNNVASLDASDVVWSASFITARNAVIYDDSTDPKYLIASLDFGEDKRSRSGVFVIQWNTIGIISIS
jgi:hypothetical protein